MFSATCGVACTPHCHALQTWLIVIVIVIVVVVVAVVVVDGDGDGDGDGDCRSDLEFQSGSIQRLSVG